MSGTEGVGVVLGKPEWTARRVALGDDGLVVVTETGTVVLKFDEVAFGQIGHRCPFP